jgi:fucose permease
MPAAARDARSVLVLAYVAFVSLGLPDTVLGVAWPSLRVTFGLPQAALGAVQGANVAGYFVSGLVAGRVASALGVGGVLALSTALVSAGLAGYALAPAWGLVLPCAVVIGLGSGAVDAALNAHAAIHFAPRHMNWLHACYSTGAMLGPAAMTVALAGASFRVGYAGLSVALGGLALAFAASRGRWGVAGARGPSAPGAGAMAALRLPRVRLQIATFFVYTGLEASAGLWAFTVLREARGVGLEAAGTWTGAYWGSIAAGRVAVGFAVKHVGPDALVRGATAGALAGAIAWAALPGAAGAAGLLVLGLSLAPVFPMLMSRTPERVGHAVAAHAVGFQVSAATLGSAVWPAACGWLADAVGSGAIPIAVLALAITLAALCAALTRTPRSS